jgi:hypothetical protein
MRSIYGTCVVFIISACLAGCAGQPSISAAPAPSAPSEAQPHNVRLELDHPSFTLKHWKMDGSHITSVKGRLLLDNQPVAGSILHASNISKDIMTGEDGSFELTVDQSMLASTKVNVKSLERATVSGKALAEETSKDLLAAGATINVYYPIRVSKVENSPQDSSKVQIHGQIVANKEDVVTYFQVDKYRIGGVVKDADGRPVQNAVVWFDREEGEGFGKSTPTDKNGRYSIYYVPENEETNLTVTLGTKKYTLPEGKVFIMPEHTSVEINIALPKAGTIIEDKPPSLVSITSPGAMYTGILAGLNVPENTPYTVTIPNKDGNFIVTVPKQVWEQKPAFFETNLSKFVEKGRLTWGDSLPPNFVKPGPNDPKNITNI